MLRILAGTAAFAALALLWAQGAATGPQVASFVSRVDDSDQPYALYVPPDFDPARKYPLVISLHAEESSPEIGLMRVFGSANRVADGSLAPLRLFHPRDVEFLVASPLARGTMGYEGIAERDVYDVLADVERRFPVDEDRVYLTGISMGGGGALRLALTRPDVWAAVAVVCGEPTPGLEVLAGNALNVPVRLFHGELDPLVPAESSRQWQRRLLDAGVPTEYIEYPAVRHNAWDSAYRGGAVFEWFRQFRRNRFPERVRLTSDSYRYGSAYWVRMDGLTPGVAASIDARQTGPGAVRVDTQNLDGFTISLDHPVAEVTIDNTALRFPKAASVSFRKQGGVWQQGMIARSGKGPGAEGPIAEAVSGRHIYVYGTGGTSSSDEMDERRKVAEEAAGWSTARERLRLKLKVKADLDVTEQDLANGDLVLFGTRETNSVIARFADRLPLALSPGAADYGLLFLAPMGAHYVLVNSGLPFWTGWDGSGIPSNRFGPRLFQELSTLGDFVVFKGSMAHVVASGRFDRSWKVPAEAAAKISAAGTVSVK
ncbi:MAG: dienelactone hydrolase family protein [Acidobacteriia bacterium]|nr:dienelactone hydrolase family protein [Terriglobia bacterium]